MASSEQKAQSTEMPIEQKLKALYDLQQVSSKIDKIHITRGELPLEVQDLEDELAGLSSRVNNLNEEIKKLNDMISDHKNMIRDAELLIAKYQEQQNAVHNNREYDSLAKEIEYQELERQLSEKRIREHSAEINKKQEILDNTMARMTERQGDLDNKKAELETIVAETRQEEESLEKQAAEISKGIDERLLTAFHRIRSNAHNGLAVVSVNRDACGGCFNHIPPQRVLDICTRKKIIVCEYCGRILVDYGRVEETAEPAAETKKK